VESVLPNLSTQKSRLRRLFGGGRRVLTEVEVAEVLRLTEAGFSERHIARVIVINRRTVPNVVRRHGSVEFIGKLLARRAILELRKGNSNFQEVLLAKCLDQAMNGMAQHLQAELERKLVTWAYRTASGRDGKDE